MMSAGPWLAVALGWPFAMLAACLWGPARARMPSLLALAPAPALGAALFARDGALALPHPLLGLSLSIDRPGAMLLGAAALLWAFAGLYASAFLETQPSRIRFAMWWLVTLTGSLGVFVAADLVSFYILFSMASLAAYGLIAHDATPGARHAGGVYVALALSGEGLLLMAFVLLASASPRHSLLIRDAAAALPGSPWHGATMALLLLAFGLKIGLVPFHVWMPLAYPAAPIPAAAGLSGIVVKAGVIGLIRFLPFQVADVGWGGALATAGLMTAYYGVAVGITQTGPKTILAYSSVSQMGLIATVLGTGLSAGDKTVAIPVALYAANHILVKGALFLGIGVVQATGARRARAVSAVLAVLALSLGGLPLTGGAVAKLVVKAPLGGGIEGTLASASAVGSVVLMCHFLARLRRELLPDEAIAPRALAVPWMGAALASMAVPWALYLGVGDGTAAAALSPAALWAASWPVLLGVLLFPLVRRCEPYLPRIPAGDIEAPAEGAVRTAGSVIERAAARLDVILLQWQAAGLLLVGLLLILGATLLSGP